VTIEEVMIGNVFRSLVGPDLRMPIIPKVRQVLQLYSAIAIDRRNRDFVKLSGFPIQHHSQIDNGGAA
jgi:hypothetical protein